MEKLFGGFRHLNAYGPIVYGDAGRFLDLIKSAEVPPRTTVYINSKGGNVEEAIKLGCVIRNYSLETSIGTYVLAPNAANEAIINRDLKPGRCFSSATLMFAGGRLRHFPDGARFGVHRFAYKNPTPEHIEKSQELSADIAHYLHMMGVSLGFLSLSAAVPSNELREIPVDRLLEHRMVTGGITDVTWGTEILDEVIYVRGTRESIFGIHKVMLGHVRGSGFKFFAVVEAQGRQRELCDFSLVEIVVNGEQIRIDISSRCTREATDIDVILMCDITDEEASLLAHSTSFGVQVRFSKDAEVFLGISAMNTQGGGEKLRALYKNMSGGA